MQHQDDPFAFGRVAEIALFHLEKDFAVGGAEPSLLSRHAQRTGHVEHTQAVERHEGVSPEREPGTHLFQLRRAFEDLDRKARLPEPDRRGQPADASANDDRFLAHGIRWELMCSRKEASRPNHTCGDLGTVRKRRTAPASCWGWLVSGAGE